MGEKLDLVRRVGLLVAAAPADRVERLRATDAAGRTCGAADDPETFGRQVELALDFAIGVAGLGPAGPDDVPLVALRNLAECDRDCVVELAAAMRVSGEEGLQGTFKARLAASLHEAQLGAIPWEKVVEVIRLVLEIVEAWRNGR